MLGSRLDFPGALHHVYARAISGLALFRDDLDRARFLTRVARVFRESGLMCLAWALMETHFHLAVITGPIALWKVMQRIEDGYAKEYNLRCDHHGHVFQGRYGSSLVESERYQSNLGRYIHLNPLKAKMVASLDELADYPWTGYAALMGRPAQPFHDVGAALEFFGSDPAKARVSLRQFMSGPDSADEILVKPVRLVTPWGNEAASVVGGAEFIRQILESADLRVAESARPPAADLKALLKELGGTWILRSPASPEPSARQLRVTFARTAVLEHGFRRDEVARFLRLSPSAVSRYVACSDPKSLNIPK